MTQVSGCLLQFTYIIVVSDYKVFGISGSKFRKKITPIFDEIFQLEFLLGHVVNLEDQVFAGSEEDGCR